jgi:hypothetical protein
MREDTTSLTGGRRKAAKLPFNQPGKGNRRPISKIGPYDLHANRQARLLTNFLGAAGKSSNLKKVLYIANFASNYKILMNLKRE